MLWLILSFAAAGTLAVDETFFATHPDHCTASAQLPRKPRPLEFCYNYNYDSCCTPGNDAAAKEAFYGVMSLGLGCSPSDHRVRASYHEIREFMCMGCDPREPSYRFLESAGDGVTPGNVNASADSYVWRVCASFLYGRNNDTGLWGGHGGKFDECGINLPTACSPSSNTLNDGDVSVSNADGDCGSDIVFPRAEYAAEASSVDDQRRAARTLLSVLPQWLPNFKFVVVDDTHPDFNRTATPCFAGSARTASSIALAMFVAIVAVLLSS